MRYGCLVAAADGREPVGFGIARHARRARSGQARECGELGLGGEGLRGGEERDPDLFHSTLSSFSFHHLLSKLDSATSVSRAGGHWRALEGGPRFRSNGVAVKGCGDGPLEG